MYYKNVIGIYKYITQHITRYYSCIVSTSTIMTIIKILVFHNSHPQSPAKASITNRKRRKKKNGGRSPSLFRTSVLWSFRVCTILFRLFFSVSFILFYVCLSCFFCLVFLFWCFLFKQKETTRKMKNRRKIERVEGKI